MDSGLGSDEDRRTRTKEQKQRHNQQLLSGCFIDAASLTDDGEEINHRRTDERRQGALIFQTSIPNFSMLQMSSSQEHSDFPSMSNSCSSLPITTNDPNTPFNSIVQLDAERVDSASKTPLGFYVDLNDVEEAPSPTPSTSAKKNIFSMVIDFEAPKKDMPSRLSSSLTLRRRTLTENKNKKKPAASSSDSAQSNANSCENSEINLLSNGKEIRLKHASSSSSSCSNNAVNYSFENNEEQKETEKVDVNNSTEITNAECLESKEENVAPCGCEEQTETETEKKEEEKPENVNENANECTAQAQHFVKLSDLDRQAPRPEYTFAPKMSRSIPESSWVESPLLMSRSAGYRSAPHPIEPESSELSDTCSFTDSTSQPRRSAQRLGTDLLRMFLEEIGPDVTVEVDGHRLRAHKCILASRCQYFAAMLSGNWLEASGNVISLQGFTYESVYFALCHIYSGAAHVPDSISLVELASLADMLGLEGLKEVVEHALKQRHCHNFHRPCAGCCTGVVEVLPLAAAYGLDDLYQRCLQWITKYFAKVWPSRAFAGLPKELREKCYHQHIVHMCPETVLETALSCDKLLASVPSLRWAEPIAQLSLQLSDACQLYISQHFAAVLSASSALEPAQNFTGYESRDVGGARGEISLSALDSDVSRGGAGLGTPEAGFNAGVSRHFALELGVSRNFDAGQSHAALRGFDSGLNLGVHLTVSRAEERLLAAGCALGPEQACRGYVRCCRMLEQIWAPRFQQMLVRVKGELEQVLIRHGRAEKLARCSGWSRMDPALRLRIKELGNLQIDDPPLTRLPRFTPTRSKKHAPKPQPAPSSSESSRNSSPGMNPPHSRLAASAGSPSLRRSLLLAARQPQVPQSPSINRRSTLTQPTQSSAAKSAPSRNLKPEKSASSKAIVRSVNLGTTRNVSGKNVNIPATKNINMPAKNVNAPAKNSNHINTTSKNLTNKETNSRLTTRNKYIPSKNPANNSPLPKNSLKKVDSRSNSPKLPVKSKINTDSRSNSPKLPAKSKLNNTGSSCNSPNKLPVKSRVNDGHSRSSSPNLPDKSKVNGGDSRCSSPRKSERGGKPTIQRSDTFLKEEPSVLQKI